MFNNINCVASHCIYRNILKVHDEEKHLLYCFDWIYIRSEEESYRRIQVYSIFDINKQKFKDLDFTGINDVENLHSTKMRFIHINLPLDMKNCRAIIFKNYLIISFLKTLDFYKISQENNELQFERHIALFWKFKEHGMVVLKNKENNNQIQIVLINNNIFLSDVIIVQVNLNNLQGVCKIKENPYQMNRNENMIYGLKYQFLRRRYKNFSYCLIDNRYLLFLGGDNYNLIFYWDFSLCKWFLCRKTLPMIFKHRQMVQY